MAIKTTATVKIDLAYSKGNVGKHAPSGSLPPKKSLYFTIFAYFEIEYTSTLCAEYVFS